MIHLSQWSKCSPVTSVSFRLKFYWFSKSRNFFFVVFSFFFYFVIYFFGVTKIYFCVGREALEFVRTKRSCVHPNDRFVQQLKEYEAIYRAEQTALQGQCSQEKGQLKRKHDQTEEEASFNSNCEPMDQMTW